MSAIGPPSSTEGLRAQVLADPSIPEPVRRALEGGHSLESIHLDAQGRWWHAGRPIEHRRISALFSRSIARTPGGTYMLRIAPFTYPVTVEDTPRFVDRVRIDASLGRVELAMLGESSALLDPATLRYERPGRLLCEVDGLEARFLRPAYHALLDHLEAEGDGYVLALGPVRVSLVR